MDPQKCFAQDRELQENADSSAVAHDTPSGASDLGLAELVRNEPLEPLGQLGPYRLLKRLGAGGMGVVYVAEDSQLQRRAALKVMQPRLAAEAAARQRFLREARAAAALTHDHIVGIYQVGEERGIPFIAMQLLEGESLQERMRREKILPVAEVLRIGREIAAGLDAAHAAGVIHRDIKPANIWLEATPASPAILASLASPGRKSGEAPPREPPRPRVKILDFGLARAQNDDTQLSDPGAVLGTPAFMAPEQARGQGPVDARADLFSLGCVLYALTTGAAPFQAETRMGVLTALATETPPAPHVRCPAIPPALSEFIMQLLDKDPARRPATARAVVARLADIERQLTSNHHVPARGRGRGARRVALVGCAALALALLSGVLYVVTDHGAIEIVTEDDRVKVVVEQGGKQVLILDPQARKTWTLNTGTYKVRLQDGPDGLEISLPHTFDIQRGGKQIVTIRKVAAPPLAQAKPPTAAEPKAQEPAVPPSAVIDLLALIDPAKDGDPACWQRQGPELLGHAAKDKNAVRLIRAPYLPPKEYDVVVELTRKEGEKGPTLLLSRKGEALRLSTRGTQEKSSFGLSWILTKEGKSLRRPLGGPTLELGGRYRIRVAVRENSVQVSVDGKSIGREDMTGKKSWTGKPEDRGYLGISVEDGAVLVHRFEVIEVHGKGTLTRGTTKKTAP